MRSNHIYNNVWEPIIVSSNMGFHGLAISIGDSTRGLGLDFLKNEINRFEMFARWKAIIRSETGLMRNRLGFDGNGDQFCSEGFDLFDASIRIKSIEKIPMIPRWVGTAELVVCEIIKRVQSIKCFIESSKQFWANSVVSAIDIELWYGMDHGLLEEITWMKEMALSAIPFFWSPYLGISLVFMLLYVWSREFPIAQVNIYGLVSLKAFYLPWAMLALDVIFGSPIMPDLLGIMAGHLYYFLTAIGRPVQPKRAAGVASEGEAIG
ncbi:hypothetical protein GIB67_032320 [Kingdonia uniflora]|uniref:Derlin n=1 Tax=Kingdonia uniflora TaxID=39325 RepID=A0A7J7MX74_9MAGN|nr:hypothetical protein GIB67_032320 [Kingdonia uniflora]